MVLALIHGVGVFLGLCVFFLGYKFLVGAINDD